MKFTSLVMLCLVLAVLPIALWAAEFTSALTAADLDVAQCLAFDGGRALGKAPDGVLEVLLGMTPAGREPVEWTTGFQPGKVLSFRVAFKQPVAIGTLISTYGDGRKPGVAVPRNGAYISLLKAEAPYPGDVMNAEQWTILPAGEVKTLPPGTKTRALRFIDLKNEWGYASGGDRFKANFRPVLLYQERYYSALNIGSSKTSGKQGAQQSWLGTWNEPQTIAGIVALGKQPAPALVEALKPEVTEPAVLAVETDWKKLGTLPAMTTGLYRLPQPYATKALRLVSTGFGQVVPLVNLGEKAEVPSTETPPPAFCLQIPHADGRLHRYPHSRQKDRQARAPAGGGSGARSRHGRRTVGFEG